MVVAHIIDSLDAGGSETVAVNMVNALASREGVTALLIVGRNEGQLSERISPHVTVVYLRKKSSTDVKAFFRLYKVLKEHHVQLVHAHSTSFVWPVFLKFFLPYKLIWHDHFGGQILANGKRLYPYISFSRFFDAVVCVSKILLQSNRRWLVCNKESIFWLPNFVSATVNDVAVPQDATRQSILCVANFRPQKDHVNLLNSFLLLQKDEQDVQLILVGNVSDENYFATVKDFVQIHNLQKKVTVVTQCNNPSNYLANASVAVLSSSSEGMPLALLEYGCYGLPVVTTEVGEIPYVVNEENGWLVPPGNPEALALALQQSLTNKELAYKKATNFQQLIKSRYSEQAVMAELMPIYESLLFKLR